MESLFWKSDVNSLANSSQWRQEQVLSVAVVRISYIFFLTLNLSVGSLRTPATKG